ncbi:MAG: NAD(P)H-hydrate epimerase, partial [Lachnospiraceae bacterium]|nr:NAD(P)H-hydrate epimerase [Lachnospiraceae bacterium]
MKYVLSSAQMKACDAYTIQTMMLPSMVLMERAALAVVQEIKKECWDHGRILVVCGAGNNGGDGFAIARLLMLEGYILQVWFVGNEGSLTEDASLQKKILEQYGGKICRNASPAEYTLVIDALFGIGLSREVTGGYADVIKKIRESGVPVIAVDMPSGISADTGQVRGTALPADATVTFAFEKLGQILYPGTEYCGKLSVADIGITDHGLQNFHGWPEGCGPDMEKTGDEKILENTVFSYGSSDLARLPERKKNANKGTCGKVGLIGGRKDMAGALILAARAAFRSGCGLVRLLSDQENRCILQT